MVRARERARGSFLYAIRGGGREQGSPAMVTAAQCLVGVLRGLGINVEVYGFCLEANPGWIWRGRLVSTKRGGTGPSAAEGAPCACRATATVLRGALACMKPRRGLGSIGRRRTALRAGAGSIGCHGWLCHRRSCRRRRCSPPPTPASIQEGVRCSVQGEGAVRNAPGSTGDR